MRGANYAYAGLRVHSEFPIPEWACFAVGEPGEGWDVRIAFAETASVVMPQEWKAWGDKVEWWIAVPEIGLFHIREGREIAVTPCPGVGEAELRLIVTGSAWAALCYQRGLPVFHMSVVSIDGRAVGFCGKSGAGKSSLAASLLARGYPLLCDDLCNVSLEDNRAMVFPASPRLKLWRDSLEALEWGSEGRVRDHFRLEKYHVPLSPHPARPSVLAALYLLEWGDLRLAPLSGSAGLEKVAISTSYRIPWLKNMGIQGHYWHQCLSLMMRVPVRLFRRPKDWEQKDFGIEALVSHFMQMQRESKG